MDEFTPIQDYNPEDEYDTIDAEPAGAEPVSEEPEPAPVQPVPEAYAQPQYPGYQQPPYGYTQQSPQPYGQQQFQPVYQQQTNSQTPQGYGQPPQNGWYPPYPPQQPYGAPAQPPVNRPADQPPVQQNQAGAYQQGQIQTPPPYPQAGNPYAQNGWQQPAPVQYPGQKQKTPTPTGTKVFIIILCALLAAMVVGFGVYVAATAGNKGANNNNRSSDNGFSFYGDDNGNYFVNPYNDGGNSYNTDEISIENEITLKEDNGDTQKRDDDNPDSVGTPDESAENITLSELPKDKDDNKYNTTSAYETVSDSVVTVVCYLDEITDNEKDIASQGTGTIISSDGYIVTNAHVLGNSKMFAVNIVMNNGEKYQAKILGYDTWTDLAVLKIDAKGLKPVTFGDSKLINVGDDVIAIGSPGGQKFQNSLTKGIVSAVDRELTINKYVRYIQSDAAISPGNSGGPLCNIYGQVIGITTAKTIATNYENMSFSIPSDTVEEIVGDLMRYGYVKGRCRIGLMGTEVSQEEATYYGYPQGIVIGSIDENGSLSGSDLKEGDIITELDGEVITSFQDIYDVLADHKPGDKVTIKAVRYE